ncbi:hypothetical protein BGZ80_009805 [Entomortierella chlamydospora]|uniref:Uncharacterized protein n=1 Tax=Entomortierella chlamydospora TaxID=101097 RepID=A0A9P6T3W9_9FUNG|nr:hypothetical protein BGZ80_009805 [Entomortierella chlamydospora]
MARERKRRPRTKEVGTPPQEPNFLSDTISKQDQRREEAHNDDHAKESSVISPNQYFTIINKRIRNVKKRIAKIDKHEATLKSDPSAKGKMDQAQIESIERKPELTAVLKELETIMSLFNEQHPKNTSDHALEDLTGSAPEKEDLGHTQQCEESITVISLQLVRFFFAIKQLEDVKQSAKEGCSAEEGCSSGLEILAPFRSCLFKAAATADISKSKSDVQTFHTMIKKLIDASLDIALEGSSATLNDLCDDFESRAQVVPRDFPLPLTSNTTLVGTTQPESTSSTLPHLEARTKAEVEHTMQEENLKPSFKQTGLDETALTSKLTDLNKSADRVFANPSGIVALPFQHQGPMVPGRVTTEYNDRLNFVEPFDQEQNQITLQVAQTPSVLRQCPQELAQGCSNTELQYQGQRGGEDFSHTSSSGHVGVQPEPSCNQESRGRGRKQQQHQRAGNNAHSRQQDIHLIHAGPLPCPLPPSLPLPRQAARPGSQLQQLTSVHAQPIFHQQYYQYPHYYYPGYPASYTGVVTNELNSGDVTTGEESEAPCQPRSLAPIHEHEEHSN